MQVEDKTFVQHVFNNTDNNVKILNGKKIFDCVGRIAIYTSDYERG